jgi:hypothetical protein
LEEEVCFESARLIVDSDSLMAQELSWPLSENVILEVAYSTYESYKILGLNMMVSPPESVSGLIPKRQYGC